MHQASLSITSSWSLLKLMPIESVMPSNHLILCHPLLLLPSIFPSIRVFSNESAFCIRWPKYRSFSFNTSPSNEYSGLISFRMAWLDLFTYKDKKKDGDISVTQEDIHNKSLGKFKLKQHVDTTTHLLLLLLLLLSHFSPTLCDPIDGSPPGSPVPGTLQAGTLEWVPSTSP